MTTPNPTPRSSPDHPGALRGVLRLLTAPFNSVWFGVSLMVFLFVFMSIGSAGYLIRQMRWAEMTEYEWFHWWPFNLAVLLLCLNITVVTIRRIRFNVVNLGVWMIHAGVIILCIGSVIYFGRKVEGDTPVFRRAITIESPLHPDTPVTLIGVPGARRAVGEGDRRVVYEVVETNPSWPIHSGEDEGKRTYSVSISVTTPTRHFVRQLLDGYPQYTEDILPGSGRAVRTLGTRLVDEDLRMSMDTHAQEWFHLMDTWALFVREVGETEWTQRPIRGMPRYNDYISSRDQVWPTFDDPPLRPDPIDIRVPPSEPDDPLAGAGLRVTGYLRYAFPETRLTPGGDMLNPLLTMRVDAQSGTGRAYELAAFDPARNSAEEGELRFTWVDSADEIDELLFPGERRLRVRVPSLNIDIDEPVEDPARLMEEPPFVELANGAFAYRVREVVDGLPMGDGTPVSIAVVDFRIDGREITRWVADLPSVTRDFVRTDDDDPMGGHELEEPDAAVDASYTPGRPTPRLRMVAGPPGEVGLLALIGEDDGTASVARVRIGERTPIDENLSFLVTSYSPTARPETRPRIVPPSQRDSDARTNYAMVKVELDTGGRTESRWLVYNHYAFPDETYAYGGRFRYAPERIRLSDGREFELLFSRERRRLPEPIILEDFNLITHVGGFTGSVSSIRDWESELRFLSDKGPSELKYIRTNAPAQHAGLRYFQAMWDPPDPPRFEGDVGTAGLNFTGVGVGNREGVITQLAGCTIAVIGMLYAFYAKPVIKRRRRERVLREMEAKGIAPRRDHTDDDDTAPTPHERDAIGAAAGA